MSFPPCTMGSRATHRAKTKRHLRRGTASRWIAGLGWAYLLALLALLTFKLVPARVILMAHVAAAPLYVIWALNDYSSFACATMASLGFVQVEPAPFDILAPVLALTGIFTGRIRPRLTAGLALITAAVLWGIVSRPWWVDPARGDQFLGTTIYLCALMLCFSWLDDSELPRALMRGYAAACVAAVALGIAALVLPKDFTGHLLYPTPILVDNPLSYRLRAFFKDPNVFGAFVAAPLVIALHAAVDGGKPDLRGRLLAVSFVACCALGLMLSYSRGSLLSAACAAVVYLTWVANRRRRLLRRTAMVLALAGAAVAVLVGSVGLGPSLATRLRVQGYDTQRIAIQRAALGLGVPDDRPVPAVFTGASLTDRSMGPTGVSTPSLTGALHGWALQSVAPISHNATEQTPSAAQATANALCRLTEGVLYGLVQVPLIPVPQGYQTLSAALSKTRALLASAGEACAALAARGYHAIRPAALLSGLSTRTLAGLGPGQSEQYYGRSVHSLYIRLFIEGGVVGLCLFLAGLVLLARDWRRSAKGCGWECAGFLIAPALLGILVQGATIDIIHWRHFWIVLGVMSVASSLRLAGDPEQSRQPVATTSADGG